MSESWQPWVGCTVDGRFPLLSYLGGSDHSAVFLTLAQGGVGNPEKAVIKLISADAPDAEKQLQRWETASELTHPNLTRIFAAGRCELEGTALFYVLQEYAEENLSQILPERALTAEEARGMLPPILRALQGAHDLGLAHGRIQPSNILAVADQVKLSSDALGVGGERRPGASAASAYDPPEAATEAVSTATDIWQLGMTLVEALTQRLPVWDRARPSVPEVPATVPEPFREIAKHCLQVDPGKRWTIKQISDRLGAELPVPTSAQTEKAVSAPAVVGQQNVGQQNASAKWPYVLGLAAVVAIACFLIARPKRSGPPPEVQSTQAQHGAAAGSSQSAPAPTPPKPKPRPAAPGAAKVGHARVEGATAQAGGEEKALTNTDTTNPDHQSGVVQRVMPQVSMSALRTIQGKVKVRVKVEVDAAGNAAKATLESAGPSKYFSRAALEAARGWKFSPAQSDESGTRQWTLQFAFSRAKTEVSAERAKH
ncbi:MAG: TonB family protein [Terriglobales bacterium]|jgi:TonB family protein